MFDEVMALIEEIAEGEKELEDMVRFGGMVIPYHVVTERFEDADGNECENEYVEYDYKYATADRSMFTEEQCREIEEAWGYAYQNVLDSEDMYDITKDWGMR